MKRNVDMLHGSLYSGVIRYVIPIMLTNFFQHLFHAADMVIVGRYCGSICVGAVTATGSLTSLITNLMVGLSLGIGVIVARGLGAQQDNEVHRAVHCALPTALVGGALISIIGVVFAEDFLTRMNTSPTILPLAKCYMQINFSGMVFTMVYNFCASILRASGDTQTPLFYLTLSGFINVVLNIIFVTLFHMDVDGVALATVISKAVSAVLVLLSLTKREGPCHLSLQKIRFYKKPMLNMFRIGLPAGIQNSLFSISNVLIQSSINSFGSDAFTSGNGAAQNIDTFLSVGLESFAQASLNFTAQNAGAGNFERVRKAFTTCLIYVFVLSAVAGSAVWFLGELLLSFYITDSPEAIAYGLIRFTYIALPYCLGGMMNVSTGALRGLGVSFIPMLISVLGVCGIRIIWIYTIFQIPTYHTPAFLYLVFPISWAATFIMQTVAYLIVLKRKSKTNRLQAHIA